MGRGLVALFLVCCALVALTLVNLTAARDADVAESARIEFEHTPSDAEWEAIKAQTRYWQQLADQEPAR
uniref:Putative secreted protein midgut overexpressed n=1 Tax=Rhipicephalus microplus TaxID=6941 RepID=A0A6M2DBA6_RHIMP